MQVYVQNNQCAFDKLSHQLQEYVRAVNIELILLRFLLVLINNVAVTRGH